MPWAIFALGRAPIWRAAMAPFLKIISVGIDMMPYLAAVAGFSSTLTFTTLSLPCSSPAPSSTMGEITRQGPHHSAQKSTSTGSADFSTSASKDESLALATAMRTSAGVENRGVGVRRDAEPRYGG